MYQEGKMLNRLKTLKKIGTDELICKEGIHERREQIYRYQAGKRRWDELEDWDDISVYPYKIHN